MNEFNFDKLKNIDIPQKWVDGAIDVPPAEKEKTVITVNFRRVIPFVACLLVVCLVCFSPLLRKNNDILPAATVKNPQEVIDTYSTENSEDVTQSQEPTKNTENNKETVIRVTDGNLVIESETSGVVQSVTNDKNKTEEKNTKPSGNTTKPSKKPTQNSQPEPTEDKNESKPGSSGDSSNPATKPNDTPSTERPTESEVVEPDLEDPADTPEVEPSVLPQGPEDSSRIYVLFDPLWFRGDYDIYCRVYDSENNLLGDENLYSRSHKTYIVMEPSFEFSGASEKPVGYYDVSQSGVDFKDDVYYLYFYTKDLGDVIYFTIEKGVDY